MRRARGCRGGRGGERAVTRSAPTARELRTIYRMAPIPEEGGYFALGPRTTGLSCITALLTDEPVRLTNVPAITDLEKLVNFFTQHGSHIAWNRDTVPDATILKDLVELSKGKVKLAPETQPAQTADLLRAQQNGPRNEVDLRKRPGGSGGKKRHRNRKKRY